MGPAPKYGMSRSATAAHSVSSHLRISVERNGTRGPFVAAFAAGVANRCSIETAVTNTIRLLNRALSLACQSRRGEIVVFDHVVATAALKSVTR